MAMTRLPFPAKRSTFAAPSLPLMPTAGAAPMPMASKSSSTPKAPPFPFPTLPGATTIPNWDQYMTGLQGNTLDPNQLYQSQASAILARGRQARRGVAGDATRMGLGTPFMADYAREQTLEEQGLLGQAARQAQTDATTHNAGISRSLLDAALGYGSYGQNQRGQDIGWNQSLLDFMVSMGFGGKP